MFVFSELNRQGRRTAGDFACYARNGEGRQDAQCELPAFAICGLLFHERKVDQGALAVLHHESAARREFVALDAREGHLEQRVPVVGVGLERDAVAVGLQLAEQPEAGGERVDVPVGDQEMIGAVDGLEQFLQRALGIRIGELGEVLHDEHDLARHGFVGDQIQHVLGKLPSLGRARGRAVPSPPAAQLGAPAANVEELGGRVGALKRGDHGAHRVGLPALRRSGDDEGADGLEPAGTQGGIRQADHRQPVDRVGQRCRGELLRQRFDSGCLRGTRSGQLLGPAGGQRGLLGHVGGAAQHRDLRLVALDNGASRGATFAQYVLGHAQHVVGLLVGHAQHHALGDVRADRGGHRAEAVGRGDHVHAQRAALADDDSIDVIVTEQGLVTRGGMEVPWSNIGRAEVIRYINDAIVPLLWDYSVLNRVVRISLLDNSEVEPKSPGVRGRSPLHYLEIDLRRYPMAEYQEPLDALVATLKERRFRTKERFKHKQF